MSGLSPAEPILEEGGGSAPAADEAAADLRSIADAALAYSSLEDILSELLERIRCVVRADTAAILLYDEERGVLVARAARGLEEEVRQGVQVPIARGFAGRIAAEARPIIIEDLDHADVVNPILRQRGIRSMLGVPLQLDGRVIGVMHVGTLDRRDFQDDDVALLQLAADRAARAIDQARATESRAVTEIMQRSLLPDALPQIPGVRFSAKYLPAGSGIKVGGDWYDVFQLDHGRVSLVIGDVVGRGVLAASVMGEIRTALRAYMVLGYPVADVVRLLNDLLVSMGRNRGATLAILEFDPDAETIEAVVAGHLPPLLIDPSGTPRLIEQTPGPPIGIRAGQRYPSERHPFPTGSKLLLYTDGLIEQRGEAIDDGLKRLTDAAEVAVTNSDASLADRVYRMLVSEAPLEDDIALLAVETLPLTETLELTLPARPLVLAGLRNTVGRWLRTMGVDDSAVFDITLSTSEAATNAIEHAYGAREASFTVHCESRHGTIEVTVTDTGRWRTSRSSRGGRGLQIMRALMDTVEIDSAGGGTIVTMTRSPADRT